jgi:hypothetical protein
MKDYRNTKFKPENDSYFNALNSNMNSILDTTRTNGAELNWRIA